MMAVESLHGALRRALFGMDPTQAIRLAGVAVGTVIVLAVAWASWRWMRVRNITEATLVGLGWLVLTLSFEFGLGRATGLSWSRMAQDYDLPRGGLMPLGLAVLAASPLALLRLRGPAA